MDPIDCTPPEYILPGSRERPLCPLQPQNRDWKVRFLGQQSRETLTSRVWMPVPEWTWLTHVPPSLQPLQCLKVLTMSGWNPPPGNRKMHGDLMYLFVITAEDRQISITASTRGFYLNQCVPGRPVLG